jgi:DHA2 family multidrug resistance protein
LTDAALHLSAARRTVVIIGSITGTIMSTLDTTIANVALPHMQASLSAAPDQIGWVLTSYIIAIAIFTPLTGWLAERIGRRALLATALIGFTVTSMLCGVARTIPEMVIARFLQGVFCAPIVPMSQTLMLDVYRTREHGKAMAIWSSASNVGPIMGPLLGGWLTDSFDWRWVFFINLPFGIVAAGAVLAALPRDQPAPGHRLDGLGYGFLVLAVGSLQLMLDRGQQLDWFESPEIIVYALLAPLGLYLFATHVWTARRGAFIDGAILGDRNFVVGIIFCFMMASISFSTMALVPTLMQDLMGYSAYQTGLATVSRGLVSVVGGFIAAWMANRADPRLLIIVGFLLFAVASWQMTGYALGMDSWLTVVSGGVQGLGTALLYVPLVTLAFSTIDPRARAKASALFSLIRNLGAAVGISGMQVLLYRNAQTVHARLAEGVRPDNPIVHAGSGIDLTDLPSLLRLNGELTRQAQMVAYVDDFWLQMLGVFACLPVVLLFRTRRAR